MKANSTCQDGELNKITCVRSTSLTHKDKKIVLFTHHYPFSLIGTTPKLAQAPEVTVVPTAKRLVKKQFDFCLVLGS